jgi:hypothetical protein
VLCDGNMTRLIETEVSEIEKTDMYILLLLFYFTKIYFSVFNENMLQTVAKFNEYVMLIIICCA